MHYHTHSHKYPDAIAYTSADGAIHFGVIIELIQTTNARGTHELMIVQPMTGQLDRISPETACPIPVMAIYDQSWLSMIEGSPAYVWAINRSEELRNPRALVEPDAVSDSNTSNQDPL